MNWISSFELERSDTKLEHKVGHCRPVRTGGIFHTSTW